MKTTNSRVSVKKKLLQDRLRFARSWREQTNISRVLSVALAGFSSGFLFAACATSSQARSPAAHGINSEKRETGLAGLSQAQVPLLRTHYYYGPDTNPDTGSDSDSAPYVRHALDLDTRYFALFLPPDKPDVVTGAPEHLLPADVLGLLVGEGIATDKIHHATDGSYFIVPAPAALQGLPVDVAEPLLRALFDRLLAKRNGIHLAPVA